MVISRGVVGMTPLIVFALPAAYAPAPTMFPVRKPSPGQTSFSARSSG